MIFIGVISIATLTSVIYIYAKQPKMAYVRVPYLYDNFEYKKEMQAKMTNVLQGRKSVLDSLELHLKILSGHLQNEKKPDEKEIQQFSDEREKYLTKKQQFEEDDNNASKRYADEILKQLTQYVDDYGRENGYTYILGAEGSGAIMSADERNDITNAVLIYINEKYKGKK
jgi:outer membrane protein